MFYLSTVLAAVPASPGAKSLHGSKDHTQVVGVFYLRSEDVENLELDWELSMMIIPNDSDWWLRKYPSERDLELVSLDDEIPNIWKNKTCSKPPTRIYYRMKTYDKSEASLGTTD